MASPTYSNQQLAHSPPYPMNAQLSQKRKMSDMPTAAPSKKARKASMLSNASHPLRQTSFPPENANQSLKYSRSPSFDTMSITSGVSTHKKKRGQKSKGKAHDDDTSTVGGRARSTVSGTNGNRKREQSREESPEEEGGGDMALDTVNTTEEEQKKEKSHRATLVERFDQDQMEKFHAWRSFKLSDAVVRRIVNQTLSQSAPANVILAVKSVAKTFAGELLDGARRVRDQWDEKDNEAAELLQGVEEKHGPIGDGTKEFPRGPLTADHLRESLRRYKVSREGNSTGQLGLWQQQQSSGVERFGTKVMGKRLFK